MIFIIISIVLFSYNNVLWKKNLKTISIPFLVTYRALLTSVISVSLLFLFYKLDSITINGFIKISIGSVFGVI